MDSDRTGSVAQPLSLIQAGRAMIRKHWLIVYITLVVLSQIVQWTTDRVWSYSPAQLERILSEEHTFVELAKTPIPAMDRDGPVGERIAHLASIEWAPSTRFDRPPVILLHGSPGQASDHSMLGPVLAKRGETVFTIDLPGFGNSTAFVPSYSVRAAAHSVLAFMDERDIDRAHVVGWSNSGGVILNMADIAPERVASLTLLAATGAQHTEGSGNYYFEHAKYALGYGAVVVLPEFVPHFGVFGDLGMRNAFIRSFWDTDQRPLEAIMGRIETPTLILQGRHDPLVADWAAEEHHRLMPSSRLVMLDASHFLPFSQADTTASYLTEFFRRHDQPGVEPLTDALILEPKRAGMFGELGARIARIPREQPWWISALGIAAFALVLPRASIVVAGLAAGLMHLDIGIALVGLLIGRSIRKRPELSAKAWLKSITGTFVLLFLASILAPRLARIGFDAIGMTGAILAIAATLPVLAVLSASPQLFTWRGRSLLKARLARATRHEYWPIWAIYLPIIPHLLRLSFRFKGPLVFTACNPAIANGGGMVGESKHEIMQALKHAGDKALHAVLIPAGSSSGERAALAISNIESNTNLGGYPVVLKPNAGQRGEGVSIARNDDDVRAYFKGTKVPIVLQRFHPGPCECGILWCRNVDWFKSQSLRPTGSILSITRKTFAQVAGDGGRTIEQLVYASTRFAPRAKAMLAAIDDDPHRIPLAGERVALGQIGNHSFGTIFSDGADLITPELQKAIDQVSAAFLFAEGGGDGGGLDVGRYDIRYESDEALMRGEGFAIVELNGVTGESTNLYDPDKSLAWAIGVMKDHWSRMYALGAQRKASGHKPLSIARLICLLLTNH